MWKWIESEREKCEKRFDWLCWQRESNLHAKVGGQGGKIKKNSEKFQFVKTLRYSIFIGHLMANFPTTDMSLKNKQERKKWKIIELRQLKIEILTISQLQCLSWPIKAIKTAMCPHIFEILLAWGCWVLDQQFYFFLFMSGKFSCWLIWKIFLFHTSKPM